jgi:CubicO group peptidase (beta-lactamase class C family)
MKKVTLGFLAIMNLILLPSIINSQSRIVPEKGYQWPEIKRNYWPTAEWLCDSIDKHGISLDKMNIVDSLANSDNSLRSLLVVKDGFIVFEKYYNEGGIDESTEVWSVTKAFTSALIGIAIDQGYIDSPEKLVTEYLSEYPAFNDISIRHVLTHTTGLNWDESNQQSWIQSEDWIEEALSRGFFTSPGKTLLYSSANSHFLSKLIKNSTGKTPGEYANDNLFNPLGIKFIPSNQQERYSDWQELHSPIPNSWRQDNNGLEIGAFGLHLTARDMAKFGFLYLNKGVWQEKTLISESWVEKSTIDYVHRTENFGFGFHWIIIKRHNQLCFEADCWGGQMISVIPALDMIVVIKCDEINPRNNESYNILESVIKAAL